MLQHVSGCLARKYDGEFLSPAAVGLSSTRDARQPCRDHAQHLISGVVAVSVVATLEVVDVEYRDGIRRFQSQQRIVKGAARRQRRQFIVIGEQVSSLEHCSCKDERCSREITCRESTRPSETQ